MTCMRVVNRWMRRLYCNCLETGMMRTGTYVQYQLRILYSEYTGTARFSRYPFSSSWSWSCELLFRVISSTTAFEWYNLSRMASFWFKQVFGFDEPRQYHDVRSCFQVQQSKAAEDDGEAVVLVTVPPPGGGGGGGVERKQFHVGPFETPSVSELRERVAAVAAAAHCPHQVGKKSNTSSNSSNNNGLAFQHILGDVGDLHRNPSNSGAVFQAASQFNCLEMINPSVTPDDGITDYINDCTQGPTCAIACPAGTVYRNYFVSGQGQGGKNGGKQLDLLQDVGLILGNQKERYWMMQNGYAMPSREDDPSSSIQELFQKMTEKGTATNHLIDAARDQLRVGVHLNTQVSSTAPNAAEISHRVTQVYCSALPIGYYKSATAATTMKYWKPLAQLILEGLYEATLAVAATLAYQRGGGQRIKVFLTKVGGGVFQNRDEWIVQAIQRSLDIYRQHPIDVFLVHYGPNGSTFYEDALDAIILNPSPFTGGGGGGGAAIDDAPRSNHHAIVDPTPSAIPPTGRGDGGAPPSVAPEQWMVGNQSGGASTIIGDSSSNNVDALPRSGGGGGGDDGGVDLDCCCDCTSM